MILDEDEHKVLLDPKISLVKLDDEESSLKWGKWWWSDGQEKMMIFLVFKAGGGLEDRMSSEVFLLKILWEEKSKVLYDFFFWKWVRFFLLPFTDTINENSWRWR